MTYYEPARHIIIGWEEVSMMQKQEKTEYQKVISIEEYLTKRKKIREQEKKNNYVFSWDYLSYQNQLRLNQSPL